LRKGKYGGFMKLKNAFLTATFVLIFVPALISIATADEKTAIPPAGVQPAGPPGSTSTETKILTGASTDINGKFKVSLPLPGGSKESTFTLSCKDSTVTGKITSPYNPDQSCDIYNGTATGNKFIFSSKVGKTEYNFEGTAGEGKLSMTLTTQETIPLGDGTKIKTSQDTTIDGAYLVPVYSPGGIMENIFFLKTEGNALTGQMIMIRNPLKDTSTFFDGTVKGKEVSFYTRTPQSLFHFKGIVEGEKIKLTLFVTDVKKGIEGTVTY
jgi:hypothetical protein